MKTKKYWIVTSILTLLPMVLGLLLWDQLPEKLPTHFGIDGAADGWGGKAFAVFGIPLMFLVFQLIIWAVTRLDKQNRGHNEKVLNLVGLIFPAMSIFCGILIYTRAMRIELDLGAVLYPMLGLIFILIGNWSPKIKQNSTLGIKLKWTLYNEENWNKTHRFGGWCWVIGGIAFCLMGFLPVHLQLWLPVVCLVLMILAPTFYSWRLAKKQQREATWTESEVNRKLKQHPVIQIVSLVLAAVILVGVGFVMFTGDIKYDFAENVLLITADFNGGYAVTYDSIDSIELREGKPEGIRQWGFGSARLMMGWFENDEFGGHTRYSYVGTENYIVLHTDRNVMILNAESEEATRELYEEIEARIR